MILKDYQPRFINFKGSEKSNQWNIKKYLISVSSPQINDKEYDQIATEVMNYLPEKLDNHDSGYGFLIYHIAADGNYALLHWWYGENMIKQKVFNVISVNGNVEVSDLAEPDISSCVWELEVIYHEKKAWSQFAMGNEIHDGGNERYMSSTIEGFM